MEEKPQWNACNFLCGFALRDSVFSVVKGFVFADTQTAIRARYSHLLDIPGFAIIRARQAK